MTCAIAFLALASVQPAPATPFCRDYQLVLDQAYRGFRAFRGPLEADNDMGFDTTYRATLSLPGGTCRVNETEYTFQYSCTWPHDAADWTGAIAEALALGNALGDCSHLHFSPNGDTPNPENTVWKGMVAHQPGSRVKTEVAAQRYRMTGRGGGAYEAFIVMRVSYRRETHP
jgi:hypothetical protein